MFNVNTCLHKVRGFSLRQTHLEGHQVKEVILQGVCRVALNPAGLAICDGMLDGLEIVSGLWMGAYPHVSSTSWWWRPETLCCDESWRQSVAMERAPWLSNCLLRRGRERTAYVTYLLFSTQTFDIFGCILWMSWLVFGALPECRRSLEDVRFNAINLHPCLVTVRYEGGTAGQYKRQSTVDYRGYSDCPEEHKTRTVRHHLLCFSSTFFST